MIEYRVIGGNATEQTLRVEMTVRTSLFNRTRHIVFFSGHMDALNVISCVTPRGETPDLLHLYVTDTGAIEGMELRLPRGSYVRLTYTVRLALSDKHGRQGYIGDDFLVFRGGQAFLLPLEFFIADSEGFHPETFPPVAREYRFYFETGGRKSVTPLVRLVNPSWMEIYQLQNNAFVIGNLDRLYGGPGTGSEFEGRLAVYSAGGVSAGILSVESVVEGILGLYRFYENLFGSYPEHLSIVLLPAPDSGAGQYIMGGAGSSAIAASFNGMLLRDWQLLSHRMFHAFFDSAVTNPVFHMPPNLWVNEGLAVYYENVSLAYLSDELKLILGVDPDRQLAELYAQYLYMVLKYPDIFYFPLMRERELINSLVRKEFLHYYAAPIHIMNYARAAGGADGDIHQMLRFSLENKDLQRGKYIAYEAVVTQLGGRALDFGMRYFNFNTPAVPSLWDLGAHLPDDETVRQKLSHAEAHMRTWLERGAEFPGPTENGRELFQRLAVDIAGFSPVLYGLLYAFYNGAADSET